MKPLVILFCALVATAISAKPYAIIDESFTRNGCEFFRVTVWEDGNDADPGNDIKMGSNWISTCPPNLSIPGGEVEPTTTPVPEVFSQSVDPDNPDCVIFTVKVREGEGAEAPVVAKGSVSTEQCHY
ncbi:MAG: hypothetical protein RLP14_03200 [Owenweeksia sp.]